MGLDSSVSAVPPGVLAELIEASAAINASLNVEEVLSQIVEKSMRVARCEGCSIILRDTVTGDLVFRASNEPKLVGPKRVVLKPGVGICGAVVTKGEPLIVGDVSTDERFYSGVDEMTQFKTRSILALPLRLGKEIVGVLEVLNPRDRETFTEADVGPLRLLANLAATALANAQRHEEVSREAEGLRRVQAGMTGKEFIGQSEKAARLLAVIRKAANSPATVLIRGESGTGKELVAQFLHQWSDRAKRPLITVNCGALPADLLESELFGHEKGSFTGAHARKLGRFELAHGGTLFLDEVGELAPQLQVKLLRVLQERSFERVGGVETIHIDVRLISATNRALEEAVSEGEFREDLYYRLNVIPIQVPPLRERCDDIPLLAKHFLARCSKNLRKQFDGFTDEAMDALVAAPWRGNVRELENIIERTAVLCENQVVGLSDLPSDLNPEAVIAVSQPAPAIAAGESLYDMERKVLLDALEEARWNVSHAARILKIPRHHLRYRMQKWNISKS